MAGKGSAAEFNPQPDKERYRQLGISQFPYSDMTTYQGLAQNNCLKRNLRLELCSSGKSERAKNERPRLVAKLQHQITINTPVDRVYEAIATQSGLRSWWTADATVDERLGGNAKFGFHKRRTVFHMTIVELAPERIAWTCQGEPPDRRGTTITWALVASESGTIVRFIHDEWKTANEMFAICNTSWGALMHRLKAYCEGSNPGPLWAE